MSRTLQLHRPLISFDLETTGLNVSEDRIIEISCIKLQPDGGRTTLTYRLNPERAISPEASAIHGISNEDVAGCPTFADVSDKIVSFMADCDLTGFNIERFDIPMLAQEFARIQHRFPEPGTQVIDSFRIFCHFEPRDLVSAYRVYCNGTLDNAHSAEADATAAADVLLAQLQRYEDLPLDAAGLHTFCHPVRPDWVDGDGKIVWQGGEAALGFGKHRGRSLKEMAQQEPNYLRWMAQGNFPIDTQTLCKNALKGEFPVPPEGNEGNKAADKAQAVQPAEAEAKNRPLLQTSLF